MNKRTPSGCTEWLLLCNYASVKLIFILLRLITDISLLWINKGNNIPLLLSKSLYSPNKNTTSGTKNTTNWSTKLNANILYFIPRFTRNAPTSPHMDLLIISSWSSLLESGKLHFNSPKKHENENYSRKNLHETFLRILAKQEWYFVQFHTTDHWLPDILNESCKELFQMVVCQGQNCNAVYCHTQFITTQRSNAFKLN